MYRLGRSAGIDGKEPIVSSPTLPILVGITTLVIMQVLFAIGLITQVGLAWWKLYLGWVYPCFSFEYIQGSRLPIYPLLDICQTHWMKCGWKDMTSIKLPRL
ncbi:hypothetical protein BCR41DRAFT_375827 [Lobosporangium transversale]|uniref:Uncharacterized protein n=1 Tax=Lobosporangium transversale TaxID=64571 RepID=A0A1Y2G5M1_9FUNG|nr:hypothetical protein BCR41DRAFT_375827 [Lobosporangium transversale]ORY95967.1 hypothetical protein BCR41DRAFT_375827 [Lobosporangium transversale]|eukprot:XP_021875408.1 hypothetical protein BCR41DRAFT_375827 [Lobosporangium transversale]